MDRAGPGVTNLAVFEAILVLREGGKRLDFAPVIGARIGGGVGDDAVEAGGDAVKSIALVWGAKMLQDDILMCHEASYKISLFQGISDTFGACLIRALLVVDKFDELVELRDAGLESAELCEREPELQREVLVHRLADSFCKGGVRLEEG